MNEGATHFVYYVWDELRSGGIVTWGLIAWGALILGQATAIALHYWNPRRMLTRADWVAKNTSTSG